MNLTKLKSIYLEVLRHVIDNVFLQNLCQKLLTFLVFS